MLFIYKIIIGVIAGIIFTIIYEFIHGFITKQRKGNMPLLIIKGLHIHHSIIGVILVILDLFLRTYFLLGFGLGIIIWHTISERRFVFVEKIN